MGQIILSCHFLSCTNLSKNLPKKTEGGSAKSLVSSFLLTVPENIERKPCFEISPTKTATPYQVLKCSFCPWRFQSCVRSKPQFFQWFYSIFTPEIMLMLNLLQCLIFQVCSTSTIWVYSASAPTITMLDLIPRQQNWLQGMLWIQLPVFCHF